MNRYSVILPITGYVTYEVDASSEEAAIEEALGYDFDTSYVENLAPLSHLVRGNVFYGELREAEIEVVMRGDYESRYSVVLPITGYMCLEVEAESEEESIDKALSVEFDPSNLVELKPVRYVVRGNVFYGTINEADSHLVAENIESGE